MVNISNENLEIIHEVKSRDEALSFFDKIEEDYKVEIINDLDKDEILKVYSQVNLLTFVEGRMYHQQALLSTLSCYHLLQLIGELMRIIKLCNAYMAPHSKMKKI